MSEVDGAGGKKHEPLPDFMLRIGNMTSDALIAERSAIDLQITDIKAQITHAKAVAAEFGTPIDNIWMGKAENAIGFKRHLTNLISIQLKRLTEEQKRKNRELNKEQKRQKTARLGSFEQRFMFNASRMLSSDLYVQIHRKTREDMESIV